MGYQKSKHVETAQKYLHQGKIAQAISEYIVVLKHEPKDQVTLMTVGDLYVRQGETFQALEYFERLAQIYLTDGFLTKAIAIYKKITKLAPEEIRPFERLADLYVQQGVMSEARPLYLQMAEMHQRANRPAQAAGLLRKLLDAEPDNPRVQSRLADILKGMGQSADAAAALRQAAESLTRRGDNSEALGFIERALQIDSADSASIALKARLLIANGKQREAEAMLRSLPDTENGGETSKLLVDLYLDANEITRAGELAQKIFERDPKQFHIVQRVADALLNRNETEHALPMLKVICQPALSGGEHEAISDLVNRAAEALPGRIEPRELLVEIYRHTSDSFRLPDALVRLAEAYEEANQIESAVQVYVQFLERDPANENVRRKRESLEARLGQNVSSNEPKTEFAPPEMATSAQPDTVLSPEAELDEETQLFVNQTITDVDLYSSYGLTEKAVELLELVLQRVPRHTGALERLLDVNLGLNDQEKTVQLAARLEQVYEQNGDKAGAERFADLRRRFERAAPQPSAVQELPARAEPQPSVSTSQPTSAPIEFDIPVVEAAAVEEASLERTQASDGSEAESAVHEVDLSEEWAALASQTEVVDSKQENGQVASSEETIQVAMGLDLGDTKPQAAQTPVQEIIPKNVEISPADPDALSKEIDAALSFSSAKPVLPLAPEKTTKSRPADIRKPASSVSPSTPTSPAAKKSDTTGPLGNLLEELRADLEDDSNNEDPETHYNLGVAYREMGLLDEAISEFQRAARKHDDGVPFHYAMQCFTLLAVAFIEKGQPAIAVNWYEKALQLPGLEPQTVLALRYDLGVSQEMAGDMDAAQKSFLQVYGTNIDYRDVAERLASITRAR